MIEISNVTKIFKNKEGSLHAVNQVSLSIDDGQVYGIVGSGNPEKPNTVLAHHNSCFDIDEDSLKVSVALYSCYAIEYLNGEV